MKFTSTPAWSFGLKRKGGEDGLDAPGPGEYKPKDAGWNNGFKMAKSPKDRRHKDENPIGPGHYNYDYSSLSKIGPSIKGRNAYPGE